MKLELRELVQQLVDEMLDEATYRSDYIKDIVNVLVGAIGEYYKARWAEANKDPDPSLREHWDEEVNTHFEYRFHVIVNQLPTGKFDRRKAFSEALAKLRQRVPAELVRSGKEFAKDFGLRFNILEYPPDTATDEFFARCWNEYEERMWRPNK